MKVYRFTRWGDRKLEEKEAVRVTARFAVFASGGGQIRESLDRGEYGWYIDRDQCITDQRKRLTERVTISRDNLRTAQAVLSDFEREYGE